MSAFLQEIRFGLRVLRKSPGFTLVAVLTLALGIGANSAIFSLVSGILFRPLPFTEPDRLMSIRASYPRGAFVAMRYQVRTLDVATYAEGHEFNLTGVGAPVRLTATQVSAEFFSVLGAAPKLGRVFHPGEDAAGKDRFVILSHALWKERFAGDRSMVGRLIQIEGQGREVLGVMPADFRFPTAKTEIWLPLHNDPGDTVAYWAGDFMPVFGRLRPGVTLARANAEIRLFQSHVGALFPFRMPPQWNADITVLPLQSSLVADVRNRLLMLLGAVVLILLMLGESARAQSAFGISLENALTFVIGIMAVTLASWELHQNKMATRELLWQYRNQLKHFSRAHAQLARTFSASRRLEILAALGKDSMMESYLWTIHRFHREHEPPGRA